jgi:hypothetical protein
MPKGKRGRPKATAEDVAVYIEDASIKPFKIRVGERSYDVIKGDAIQPECYHAKLETALSFIARQKTSKNKAYSIAGYVKELKENQEMIAKAVTSLVSTEVV